jgi:hypothetical protein
MHLRHSFIVTVAIAVTGLTGATHAAPIGNNPGGPTTLIAVDSGPFLGTPHFVVNADIIHDDAGGNLLKDFKNTSQGSGGPASGIPSGQNVLIDETFNNTGTDAWSAWTEQVVTPSEPLGTEPGFLFAPGGITVSRNGTPLTEGVDYTLAGTPYFGSGNNGYSAITINFAPSSYIQPDDVLDIQKRIHEVFGDGNVWALNEEAQVAEYPTGVPEPAGLALLAVAGLTPLLHRRRVRPGRDW